jgi:TolB-like protein/Flp pilus assembly protein TadD
LGLPDWTGRFVFFILVIGFPLVMVFSWAYEITPEGLKREKDVPRDASITSQTAHKLNTAVVVLLVLAIGGLIVDRLIPEQRAPIEQAVETGTGGGAAAANEQSIAVLPFVNMSSDKENEYFSDGLSEELLNLLARIPELQVAARTSAFSFKNADADITEIAARLNVAHVLEGSVRKSGNDIRITAQLINASDGYHLWSETWDRTLDDVFAIQDEIAAAVVDALKVRLLGEVPHVKVTDPRAYDLYLQAKAAAYINTGESFVEARRLLEAALAIDPQYAEGWAELGTVITNQTGRGFLPNDEGFRLANRAAQRALSIDPEHAAAMSNLGWSRMYYDWDFDEAARLIRRAHELEPGNASVMNAYAVLHGVFGRLDSMTSLYEAALERDPAAMSVLFNVSGAYNVAGRYDESGAMIERMREISPDSRFVVWAESFRYWFMGDSEAALDRFTELGGDIGTFGRAISLYNLGRDEEALELIDSLAETGERSVLVAFYYALADLPDTAFEWLDRAYESRDDELVEIRMYGVFDRLDDDPRWEALLRKLGTSDADAERIGL